MRAAFLLAVFAFAPALASAQQPCTSDADSTVDAIYRAILERPAGGEGNARTLHIIAEVELDHIADDVHLVIIHPRFVIAGLDQGVVADAEGCWKGR